MRSSTNPLKRTRSQVGLRSWIQQPRQPGTVHVTSVRALSTIADALLLNLKNPSVYRAIRVLEASGLGDVLVCCVRIAEAPEQLVIALRFASSFAAQEACVRYGSFEEFFMRFGMKHGLNGLLCRSRSGLLRQGVQIQLLDSISEINGLVGCVGAPDKCVGIAEWATHIVRTKRPPLKKK